MKVKDPGSLNNAEVVLNLWSTWKQSLCIKQALLLQITLTHTRFFKFHYGCTYNTSVGTIISFWPFTTRKLQTVNRSGDVCAAMTEEWFMVLYLAAGQQAHGNEWALRRTWPPNINHTKLGYGETQSHSISTKEDIHSVPLCRIRPRNMQITSKQLYHSGVPL